MSGNNDSNSEYVGSVAVIMGGRRLKQTWKVIGMWTQKKILTLLFQNTDGQPMLLRMTYKSTTIANGTPADLADGVPTISFCLAWEWFSNVFDYLILKANYT